MRGVWKEVVEEEEEEEEAWEEKIGIWTMGRPEDV